MSRREEQDMTHSAAFHRAEKKPWRRSAQWMAIRPSSRHLRDSPSVEQTASRCGGTAADVFLVRVATLHQHMSLTHTVVAERKGHHLARSPESATWSMPCVG